MAVDLSPAGHAWADDVSDLSPAGHAWAEPMPDTKKPELSKEDLMKGVIASLVQGATMGTGGTISGAANIAATPAYKLAGAKLPEQTIGEQFASGREAFEKPLNKMDEAHPIVSTALQMAGGLPVAAMTGGASELAAETPILGRIGLGALTGAKYGAAYGAGAKSGPAVEDLLKQKDPTKSAKEAAESALSGGATGAMAGAAIPVVASGAPAFLKAIRSISNPEAAGKADILSIISKDSPSFSSFKPNEATRPIGFMVKGADQAEARAAGFQPSSEPMKSQPIQNIPGETPEPPLNSGTPSNLAKQSIDTKTPLIELADPDGSIHRLAMDIRINGTDEAKGILNKTARDYMESQPKKIVDAVNDVLGSKNHFQNLDEIKAAYAEQAAPAYEKAYAYGDLAKHENASILQGPLSQEALKYKTAEEFVKAQDTPKTVSVWNKSKFSNDGAYADIPVTRKVDNVTLYQGGSTEGRQFWTPDKKYAESFGKVTEKTGAFYKIDNGNRVADVYVETPTKSQLTDIWNKAQGGQNTSAIQNFINNEDQLQKAIKQARSSAIGRDLKGLPDTDIRVLDAAKQVMDDDISGLKRNGANKEARALDGLRTDLLKKVDTIAPEYAQARQIAGDHIRMMDAQETGAKILRSETPESIARILPEMSPAEQAALKVGFRDELIKQIGQGSKTSRANVAMKVFGETENSLTRQNMKAILGEDYAPLMKKVEPLITGGRNYSDLMGGSQTAPNQQLTGRLSLHGIVLKTLKKAVNSQMNQKTTMQARALTDPEYLRKIIGK